MRPTRLLLATIVSTLWIGSPALAGDAHDPLFVVRHIFDAADSNGDGALNEVEYEEAGLARYGVSFDQCDGDGDGQTSIEEYLEIYRRHHPPTDRSEV